jgi:hypothetical protein
MEHRDSNVVTRAYLLPITWQVFFTISQGFIPDNLDVRLVEGLTTDIELKEYLVSKV